MGCNAEPRINELVQQMRQLACDGELHVLRAYNKEVAKHNYTAKNLLDMKMQQNIIGAERGLVGPVAASRSFVAGTLSRACAAGSALACRQLEEREGWPDGRIVHLAFVRSDCQPGVLTFFLVCM